MRAEALSSGQAARQTQVWAFGADNNSGGMRHTGIDPIGLELANWRAGKHRLIIYSDAAWRTSCTEQIISQTGPWSLNPWGFANLMEEEKEKSECIRKNPVEPGSGWLVLLTSAFQFIFSSSNSDTLFFSIRGSNTWFYVCKSTELVMKFREI